MELNFLLVAALNVNPHYLLYLTIKFHHQLSVKISTQVIKKLLFLLFRYIDFGFKFLSLFLSEKELFADLHLFYPCSLS